MQVPIGISMTMTDSGITQYTRAQMFIEFTRVF